MTNPTPEEVRLVAEYMGYEAVTINYEGVGEDTTWQDENEQWCATVGLNYVGDYFVDVENNEYIYQDDYDPLTNAEQSMELLKMLLRNGWVAGTEEGENAEFTFMRNQLWIYDESLELAIFNAALAHIKGSTKAEGEG